MESDRVTNGADPEQRGRRALAVALCVLVTTAITVGGEVLAGRVDAVAFWPISLFYLTTAGAIMAFAVWTARELGLPSLLLFEPIAPARRAVRLAVYGLGVGLVLSVASVLLAGDGDSALRPWFWQRIQSQPGIVLFSARAALLEETFFRLFLIPALVALAQRTRRPRYRIRLRDGALRASRREPGPPSSWTIVGAALVSSLLFGLAHPFNPLAAILLGPLLAFSYLRGGWESAVLAHFTANWLVFSFYF